MPNHFFHNLIAFLGIQRDQHHNREIIICGIGSFISIFLILLIVRHFAPNDAGLIVASMGATAVLLFVVPHGPLSQPWPVFGGHMLSAFVGITCAKLIADPLIAAPLAVGIASALMYLTRCIHPPGGATALTTVIGSAQLHALGYQYLLTPVFINVMIILLCAIGFNYLFKWRRYPTMLSVKEAPVCAGKQQKLEAIPKIRPENLEYALQTIPSFTDIDEQTLQEIYQTAFANAQRKGMPLSAIQARHYYLHGKSSQHGVIRYVIDIDDSAADEKVHIITYKIMTGPNKKQVKTCHRDEFAAWAKHEVILSEKKQWEIK